MVAPTESVNFHGFMYLVRCLKAFPAHFMLLQLLCRRHLVSSHAHTALKEGGVTQILYPGMINEVYLTINITFQRWFQLLYKFAYKWYASSRRWFPPSVFYNQNVNPCTTTAATGSYDDSFLSWKFKTEENFTDTYIPCNIFIHSLHCLENKERWETGSLALVWMDGEDETITLM